MIHTHSSFQPFIVLLGWFLLVMVPLACVDPENILLRGTNDILVVDGMLTDLAEPQIIKINRSKADPLTGRFGTTPITKATVEVVMDSTVVIACHETVDGSYQLPSDFKGQIGHAYQLRFTLSDGTHYQSTQQVMLAVPPINRIYTRFNPSSLTSTELGGYTAAHDFYLDTQDPANERNYYRWDWKQWEKQDWCRTCQNGVYSINNVIKHYSPGGIRYWSAGDSLFEDCFYPPFEPGQPVIDRPFVYDYQCRTQCWAIFYSYNLNVFADDYTNGKLLAGQKVAQIPYYQHAPCLVEIRQAALDPAAYQYYKQLQDQTQKTGGLTDTPPAALAGNVHNLANNQEGIVGYFTASAVAATRYWLDRKDTTVLPLGATDPSGYSGLVGAELFFAINKRQPKPEPSPPTVPEIQIFENPLHPRPYTAICESKESQTPAKPVGWRD
ncbi:DUF4249 domain-containing protein [Spirosoma foliorum]|uniref:DUF4249 domain-containing protein n=1 Tax=Spirosoma foliorum TaxID=2710596 RepID=A0A7G5GMX4_9BACT|nr:DUF4249 domain-containing protein [Spirosoma foliorum]QMW00216.1 DUF4249 domain-containing protein [Spirosoma foliorum]